MSRGRFWLVALLLLPVYLFGQHHGLWRHGEMRVVQTGKEMYQRHNWAVPHLNDEVFLEKPPLVFAAVALTYRIAGHATDNLARVPGVLFAVLGALGTLLLGRRLFGDRVGWWSALILSTMVLWFERAHACSIDIALASFVALSLFFFYRAYSPGKERYSWAEMIPVYGFAVLAFYTKSFVGLVFPGLAIIGFLLWMREPKTMWRIKPWFGGVVMAVMIAPWFYDLYRQGGTEYLRIVFVDNALLRFVQTAESDLGHHTRWYWYFDIIWKYINPWALLFVPAAVSLWRSRLKEGQRDPAKLFVLVWFITGFLFLTSSSTKREVYLLPIFPAAALAIGWWLERVAKDEAPLWERLFAGVFVIGIAGMAWVLPISSATAEAGGTAWAYAALPVTAGLAGAGLYFMVKKNGRRCIDLTMAAVLALAVTAAVFYVPIYSADRDASHFAIHAGELTPEASRYYFIQPHCSVEYMRFYTDRPLTDLHEINRDLPKPQRLTELAAAAEPAYLVAIAQSKKTIRNHEEFVTARGGRLEEIYREPIEDRWSVLWRIRPAERRKGP